MHNSLSASRWELQSPTRDEHRDYLLGKDDQAAQTPLGEPNGGTVREGVSISNQWEVSYLNNRSREPKIHEPIGGHKTMYWGRIRWPWDHSRSRQIFIVHTFFFKVQGLFYIKIFQLTVKSQCSKTYFLCGFQSFLLYQFPAVAHSGWISGLWT